MAPYNQIKIDCLKEEYLLLTKLIKASYIQLDIKANSFEDAIILAMNPLLKDGAISEHYISKVISILKEIGPYIVITKNIAIPHAPPDSGANKLAIGFTRLKNAIISGNSANDPVKFLFSLSSPTGNDHLSALSELAALFSDEKFLTFINEVKKPNDFIDFLENFERSEKND